MEVARPPPLAEFLGGRDARGADPGQQLDRWRAVRGGESRKE